jgi:diguanylate cyclase
MSTASSLIRQHIAMYTQRIHELEHELLQVTTLLHEDSLTCMLNRRGFRQVCEMFPFAVADGVTVVSCAALDLDQFKRINDRYGHAIGDAALVHFAQILRMNVRPVDTMARLGGDEFVLILMEMTGQDAVALLRRLVTALANAPLLSECGPIPLHVSAGVAELRGEEAIYDGMVRADLALLEAKRMGIGQVVFEGQ